MWCHRGSNLGPLAPKAAHWPTVRLVGGLLFESFEFDSQVWPQILVSTPFLSVKLWVALNTCKTEYWCLEDGGWGGASRMSATSTSGLSVRGWLLLVNNVKEGALLLPFETLLQIRYLYHWLVTLDRNSGIGSWLKELSFFVSNKLFIQFEGDMYTTHLTVHIPYYVQPVMCCLGYGLLWVQSNLPKRLQYR